MSGTRDNSRFPGLGLVCGPLFSGLAVLSLALTGCEQKSLPVASVTIDRAAAEIRTASQQSAIAPAAQVGDDEAPPTSDDQAEAIATNKDDGSEADAEGTQSTSTASGASDRDDSTSAEPTEPIEEKPAKPAAKEPPTAVEKSNEPRECTFDTIKFNMVKGDPFHRKLLTPKIEALDGQRIRIRGYMLPSVYQKGLTEFVLVRDNMECCFGPGAALFDCIFVQFEPGKTTNFSVRPVAVEGVFSIQVLPGPDGYPLAIYHMLASDVR